MRNLHLFYLLILIIGCKEKNTTLYQVVSFNSTELREGANNFEAGDTIGANALVINLLEEESLLIKDINKNTIYRMNGPQEIDIEKIATSDVEQFNAKYFSLISSNLNKSTPVIRHTILGGVSRGINIKMNYLEGEALLEDAIELKISNLSKENCNIRVLTDKNNIFECEDNTSCKIDLSDLRIDTANSTLDIYINCENEKVERRLNIISNSERDRLMNEEEELIKSAYPDEAMLNFYLENKLYSKAKNLLSTMPTNSKLVNQLKSVLF